MSIICPHEGCHQVFSSVTAMIDHAKIYHRESTGSAIMDRKRCEICMKSVSLDQINTHIDEDHKLLDSLLQCSTCYQFFPNTGSLTRHLLVHKNNANTQVINLNAKPKYAVKRPAETTNTSPLKINLKNMAFDVMRTSLKNQ